MPEPKLHYVIRITPPNGKPVDFPCKPGDQFGIEQLVFENETQDDLVGKKRYTIHHKEKGIHL